MGIIKEIKTLKKQVAALAKFNGVHFEEQEEMVAKKDNKDPIGFTTK